MGTQKLSAVFSTDVVGYTRLMQLDEGATLLALNMLRETIKQHIDLHTGRIANTAGDSVLAEFPSAVSAVSCALTLQDALSLAEGLQSGLQLRIGIHLGDVVEQAGDLFGTAVNVAARLQSIGEPGTVMVSSVVCDSIRGKLPVIMKDLGPRELKGIDQPLRVYQVSANIGASEKALASWDERQLHVAEQRVSVAVLPFLSISADPEMALTADGLTEDIITELSRQRDFLVIARNTVFTYKGRSVDVAQVGRELNVRYVLEGSLRRIGQRLRLTTQLIDCQNGSHIWAEKFDCTEVDLAEAQDEIVRAVAASTHTQLVIAEGGIATTQRVESSVWKLHKQAWKGIYTLTVPSLKKAELIGSELVERHPDDARSHQILAFARGMLRELGARSSGDAELIEDLETTKLAVNLDPDDEWTTFAYTNALYQMGRLEEALSVANRTLALNPNFSLGFSVRGAILAALGRSSESIADCEMGIRLNPRDPTNFLRNVVMAEAHYLDGHYDLAMHWALQSAAARPDYWLPFAYVAAARQQTGDLAGAGAAMARLRQLLPDVSIERIRSYGGIIMQTGFLDRLREAGLPER